MKIKLIVISLIAFALAGCEFVTIPPATKGKILTTAGYSPDVLSPGKKTLWGRDQLILLETNTNTYKEDVTIILADRLELKAEIRFRGRIAGNDKVINSMFNDIVPGEDRVVSFNEVYAVYGRMAVRNKTREILSQYSAEDVHSNYARLSKEIGSSLLESLKGTPLEVSDIALGNIQYPPVVTAAVEAAAERDLAIKKEQAQAKVDLTRKKNERALAEANYQVEITKAKAIRDKNKIIGEGVTEALLKLRALEVQEKMAENGSAVFMPYEAIGSLAGQNRIYSTKK